uniref:Uncharacterized protein n=1 Tax=Rhizophora mucronata TaxID=61149 RepID=A0A2P2NVM0_RHIMU
MRMSNWLWNLTFLNKDQQNLCVTPRVSCA